MKMLHKIALAASFIPFLFGLLVFILFKTDEIPADILKWIEFEAGEKSFVIHYELAVDGFSTILIFLTAIIMSIAILAGSFHVKKDIRMFYQLMFLLELGVLGVFASGNLFLFFIFFEITLIPMFLLLSKWGGTDREESAFHYLVYNGIGSLILLVAIAAIFVSAGSTNFDTVMQHFATNENSGLALGIAIALLLAFGIKLPIFPLHSWMVKVHVDAPIPVVIVHAGVLLKIGAYGLITFGIGFFPVAFEKLVLVLAILGLVNLLYGAYLALVQKELRAVLAYSSISHMGIILLGIAALNESGIQGAIFQAVSHGLIAALFFLLVGSLANRTNTTSLKKLSGLARLTPLLAGFLLVAALAGLGLPGMSGFVSEFMVFLGLFEQLPWIGVIGTLGLVLTVVYMLRVVMNMTFGTYRNMFGEIKDLNVYEVVPTLVLIICIIGIGVFPNIIASTIQLTIETLRLGIGG